MIARTCPQFDSRGQRKHIERNGAGWAIDWWGGADRKGRKQTERAWKVSADDVKTRGYNLDVKNPHTSEDDHGDPEVLLAKLAAAEAETAAVREQLKSVLGEAMKTNRRSRESRNPDSIDPRVDPANADQLLTHFDRLIQTPESVQCSTRKGHV